MGYDPGITAPNDTVAVRTVLAPLSALVNLTVVGPVEIDLRGVYARDVLRVDKAPSENAVIRPVEIDVAVIVTARKFHLLDGHIVAA